LKSLYLSTHFGLTFTCNTYIIRILNGSRNPASTAPNSVAMGSATVQINSEPAGCSEYSYWPVIVGMCRWSIGRSSHGKRGDREAETELLALSVVAPYHYLTQMYDYTHI